MLPSGAREGVTPCLEAPASEAIVGPKAIKADIHRALTDPLNRRVPARHVWANVGKPWAKQKKTPAEQGFSWR